MSNVDYEKMLQENVQGAFTKKQKGDYLPFFKTPKVKQGKKSFIVKFLVDKNLLPMIERIKNVLVYFDGSQKRFYTYYSLDYNDPINKIKNHFYTKYADKNSEYRNEDIYKAVTKYFNSTKSYLSPILVGKDGGDGSQNGQIMYYEYGVSIKNLLANFLNLTEDEIAIGKEPVNVYDPFNNKGVLFNKENKEGLTSYTADIVQDFKRIAGISIEDIIGVDEDINKNEKYQKYIEYMTDKKIDLKSFLYEPDYKEAIEKILEALKYAKLTDDIKDEIREILAEFKSNLPKDDEVEEKTDNEKENKTKEEESEDFDVPEIDIGEDEIPFN